MTKRDDDQWQVTPEWQARVRRELATRGRGAQAAMQRAIGAKSSTVAELLRPGARRSHLVAAVHEWLAWPPPSTPLASTSIENRQLVESLTGNQREVVDFVLDLLLSDPTSTNAVAFVELVNRLRDAHKQNRSFKLSNAIVIDSDTKQTKRATRRRR